MTTTFKSGLMIASLAFALGLGACNKDDNNVKPADDDNAPAYALWLQLGSWPNTTQYIVGANNLNEGTVSLEGNGAEVTAMADYGIIPHKGYYYYPSTSADFGKMSKFEFKNNKLNIVKEVPFTYQSGISARTWIDDNTLVLFGTNGDADKVLYSIVDAQSLQITNGEIDLPALPNGFNHYFPGNVESSDGKIYLAYANGADWPALAQPGVRVAVIDYPSMNVSNIIQSATADGPGGDNMWMSTSGVDEGGNVYLMFNASWMTDASSPSKILRIAKGQTGLDAAYEFNVGASLGGVTTEGFWYIANGKGIVKYIDADIEASGNLHYYKFAIVDLTTKTATKLTNIPPDKGSQIQNVIADGGQVYLESNSETGKDYVWKVDMNSKTAAPGLEIVGGYDYILRLDKIK